MTISKKQLEQAREEAFRHGQRDGRAIAISEMQGSLKMQLLQNKSTLVQDAAALAHANAKMTYALGQILLHLGKS